MKLSRNNLSNPFLRQSTRLIAPKAERQKTSLVSKNCQSHNFSKAEISPAQIFAVQIDFF
jgi:hypothetical protein